MSETVGWRHFRVTQLQKKGKSMAFVLMQASCDPRAQLWVSCTGRHWLFIAKQGFASGTYLACIHLKLKSWLVLKTVCMAGGNCKSSAGFAMLLFRHIQTRIFVHKYFCIGVKHQQHVIIATSHAECSIFMGWQLT